jgi:hypothetical protein
MTEDQIEAGEIVIIVVGFIAYWVATMFWVGWL